MATTKVMISIDAELLADADAQAAARGTSRSALIADALRRTLDAEHERRVRLRREMLDRLPVGRFGGNSADLIRQGRDSR